VFDEIQSQGPMSGILTGMQMTLHDHCLVVPCDIHLVKSQVLQELVDQLKKPLAHLPSFLDGQMAI